jgi:hypothetical protein
MAKGKADRYDSHGVSLTDDEVKHLRLVWSSRTSSYWDELKDMVPGSREDADLCRAATIAVWRGTDVFERFWR